MELINIKKGQIVAGHSQGEDLIYNGKVASVYYVNYQSKETHYHFTGKNTGLNYILPASQIDFQSVRDI